MNALALGIIAAAITAITLVSIFERLSSMSAELDAVKATAATLATQVDTLLTDFAAAKANAVDPAELTTLNSNLTAIGAKITAAVTPPAPPAAS